MDSMEIRAQAGECLDDLKLLRDIEVQVQESRMVPDLFADELKAEDQLARFEIWAANIGVFADGHASLDHRLRDSTDARNLMKTFLESLKDFLLRAIAALEQDSDRKNVATQPAQIQPQESSAGTIPESVSSAISSSFQGTDTDSIPDYTSRTPFEQRLQGIERTIDRLYRLSLLIRQPSITTQNNKAEKLIITDEEGNDIDQPFAEFAFQFITHRFPEGPEPLRRRLARGITVRRKRFLYRRNHQQKLSAKTVVVPSKEPENASNVESTLRGVKVSIPGAPQGPNVKHRISPSHGLLSQTSASAMAKRPITEQKVIEVEVSAQSTVFTKSSTFEMPVQIPEPPKPGPGSKEFECPYCCIMLPIAQAKASNWRKHVLEDLEPYACVFENCLEHRSLFRDRRTWVSHMQRAHTRRWVCGSCPHPSCTFEHEQQYEQHMWASHKGTFTASQLPFLKERNKSPALVLFNQCFLCGYQPLSFEMNNKSSHGDSIRAQQEAAKLASDQIIRHLAGHLESLSVKALPWHDMFEDPKKESTVSRNAEEGTRSSNNESSGGSEGEGSRFSIGNDDAPNKDLIWPMNEDTVDVDLPEVSYDQEWSFIPRPDYHGHDRDPTLQPLLRTLYLDTSISPGRGGGPILPAYFVPVERDKNFIGRALALSAMQDFLCLKPADNPLSGSSKPISFPRCYTIHGPGGLGKTQLAAQFVTTHRNDFDAIFWVRAENASKAAQDFKEIAVALGLISEDSPDASDLLFTRDIVLRWLLSPFKDLSTSGLKAQEKASWLLVFDGAEDPDVLNIFWPYDGPGSILVTSRNPRSWSTSLALSPLSTAEAVEYLLEVTKRSSDEEEKSTVTAVANRLGGLPLVLAHIGSFIVHKQISFTEFLRSYEERQGQQRLLQWPLSGSLLQQTNRERSIASVWALDSLANGKELLDVLSMLDPDGIPEILFSHETADDDPAKDQRMEEYKKARNELLVRSLVTSNKREKKLFVHRIVQDVARARMRQSDLRETFFSCVRLLCARWPFEVLTWRHGIVRWAACEDLFPHIERLKNLYPEITQSTNMFEDYFAFARLLVDAGWYLHERGRPADAILFNNMGQSICESLKLGLIENGHNTSTSTVALERLNYTLHEISHNRGCIALEINEPHDALMYLTRFNKMMLDEFSRTKSRIDIRLAISWNELGSAYMLNEDWEDAEESFIISLKEFKKLDNQPITSLSRPLVNLGLAYWIRGKIDEAAEILLSGLHDREAALGINDRVSFVTGHFFHAIGNVRESQGNFDESLEYHRRALLHYKSTLGNRHHRTADMFVKVANHNIRLHQYDLALMLLDHALETYVHCREFLPERTRASFKRMQALQFLRRIEEAQSELSKCFAVYTQLFIAKVRVKKAQEGQRKLRAEDLEDRDFDDLIGFWSR